MLVIAMLRQLSNEFKAKALTILRGEEEATHMRAPLKQTKEDGSMRHQYKIKINRRLRRKLIWLLAAAAVCALLLEEQVAVLYVVSALAICGLMMVLAFSNLQARDAEMQTAAIREPLTTT
jgi:hypothetical protein